MSAASIKFGSSNKVSSSSSNSLSEKVECVKKLGYLKKLKTMKKKFFVLYLESDYGPSRLEYYDSEKKWKSGASPKRSICLKSCFNINRRTDTKHKFVIALYTKDDCFAVSLDNEDELDQWLTALLELQHGDEYLGADEKPRPNFEHVWQVNVKSKGLGSSKNILGPHRLCLTERTLTLVKMNTDCPEVLEFPLMSIRRCGHSECFFFMEVGRSALTGAGELWMLSEDTLIAQNMHEAILNAMKSSRKEDIAPRPRTRSSSANESSKPISVHMRRQTVAPISTLLGGSNSSRERADSMPTRPRTASDGHRADPGRSGTHFVIEHGRPRSMYSRTISSSPPYKHFSGSSGTCDSADSSLSIDECDSSQQDLIHGKYGYGLTDEQMPSEPPIEEEAASDCSSYVPMAPGEVEPNAPTARMDESGDGYMTMTPAAMEPSGGGHVRRESHPLWLPLSSFSSSSAVTTSRKSPTVDEAYMEMASPLSNASLGSPDGYLPMSPVGSSYGGFPSAAGSKSRKSSIKELPPSSTLAVEKSRSCQEETADGYVPMAPGKALSPQEDQGYLHMAAVAHSVPKTSPTAEVAAASSSSSRRSSGAPGTPSAAPADICFAEYPLDKVRAYVTPSPDDDDDDVDCEPIARACSIGSRAEFNRRRRQQQHPQHPHDSLEVSGGDAMRTRAFSMGAKFGAGGRPSKVSGPSLNATMTSVGEKAAGGSGKKSSSAPLLGTSPLGSSSSWMTSSFLVHHRRVTSSSSNNNNEDLMEMDFPDSKTCSSSSSLNDNGSTDSLLRWSGSGGLMRPGSNSRGQQPAARPSSTTHQKPDAPLQSIGERSTPAKSPPSSSSDLSTSASSAASQNNNDCGGVGAAPPPPTGGRASPYGDEYVNIDPRCGLVEDFRQDLPSSTTHPPAVSDPVPIEVRSSSSSRSLPESSRHNPEYVNLQFALSASSPPPSAAAAEVESSKPKSPQAQSSSLASSGCGDYAVMSPLRSTGKKPQLSSSASSAAASFADVKAEPSSPSLSRSANEDANEPTKSPSGKKNNNNSDPKRSSHDSPDCSSSSPGRRLSQVSSISAAAGSRPNSVGSERELHYCTLDLAAPASDDDGGTGLPQDAGGSSSSSPRSPVAAEGGDGGRTTTTPPPPFSYAKIDFVKSEVLRLASSNNNNSASTRDNNNRLAPRQ